MKLHLLEAVAGFVWADPEDPEICDGAWALEVESGINVLHKDLMGAVARNTALTHNDPPTAQDVVGAWFGAVGNGEASFDLIVDPVYQGKGIGRMLFDDAMAVLSDCGAEIIHLEVVSPIVAKWPKKPGSLTLVAGCGRNLSPRKPR